MPDLPGCYSAGSTLDEALKNAHEAIACHCEGLLLDGEPVPQPQAIENHQKKFKDPKAIWAVVDLIQSID